MQEKGERAGQVFTNKRKNSILIMIYSQKQSQFAFLFKKLHHKNAHSL